MKEYNYYNKKYGIGLHLILDKKRKELVYQCPFIRDEYKGVFGYKCKNGWEIRSWERPEIFYHAKTLYLCGTDRECAHNDIILSEYKYRVCHYTICEAHCLPHETEKTYKDIEQIYHELVDALEEVGNDYSQGEMFLDM